jgi:hypothetical protein
MSSSWSVENTIGSFSVRGVATCVPGGIDSVVGWAADSQNVIGVRAAVGGRSRTPSRSRNFTYGAVGDPVQPPQHLVDHVGERLDERDAGIVDVVVGPLGAALLDQPLGVVDQRLERAVVEVGSGKRHGDDSSAGSV